MKTIFADDRGRITLGSRIVDKYGKKFAVVSAEKEIVLVPIEKDPLKRLRQIGKEAGIDKYTLEQLRGMAIEEAQKEIKNAG